MKAKTATQAPITPKDMSEASQTIETFNKLSIVASELTFRIAECERSKADFQKQLDTVRESYRALKPKVLGILEPLEEPKI